MVQRYRCVRCNKTFSESQPLGGVRVDMDKAVQVVNMFVEGIGVRAISRLTSLNKATVLNILETAGASCRALTDARQRGLTVKYVQVDELFGFVHCKQAHTSPDDTERGDQYTFLSIERDSKLIINWLVGKRTRENAGLLMDDLKARVVNQFQLSTDGFAAYIGHLGAVFQTFHDKIDYGTEVKHFATQITSATLRGNRRENPVVLQWCKRTPRIGNPDKKFVNTSHAERLNLSVRLFNRRLTRLTLGYSKKVENLRHSIAILVAYYNFCRVHSAHKLTPAMAAGITDHRWTLLELLSSSDNGGNKALGQMSLIP